MQAHSLGPIAFQICRAPRQSDRALDERAQLFRLWERGDNAFVGRVDERSRQISQQRNAMFRGPSEFSMCLKMAHVASLGAQASCLLLLLNCRLELFSARLSFSLTLASAWNWIALLIELHSEVKTQTTQNVANFTQGLLAEIFRRQHLAL